MTPSNAPFWAIPQAIHFQSKAPLDAIVNALRQLHEAGPTSERCEMVVDSVESGYRFQYSLQRATSHGNPRQYRWYTTAVGEGHIWQDATGLVTVDGVARIDSSLYGTIAFILVLCIVGDVLLVRSLSLLFVLSLIMSAVMVYNYYRDQQSVVGRISEAVGNASHAEKAKRAAINEAISSQTAHDHAAQSHSVWNEAVSEYNNQQEQ